MANLHTKLSESLETLKRYQETTGALVVKGKAALGKTHTERLLDNGFLEPVVRGWYLSSFPGQDGDTGAWYASYWHFIAAYCNDRFGEEWCLTAEESLALHSGCNIAPRQIVVRSPKASNNITPLKHGDTLLDVRTATAKEMVVEPVYGLRLYSVAEALVFASPTFFTSDPINARTCLASVSSAESILRIVADAGNSSRAGRIVGAMRNIGRDDVADAIQKFMTRLGYDVRPTDPFEERIEVARAESPLCTRIRLMWRQMSEQLAELQSGWGDLYKYKVSGDASSAQQAVERILEQMDAAYVHDAYHSLSIEGYRVTEGLIERVRSGKWNPQGSEADASRRDALAARGYYQAFQAVRESVRGILGGKDAADVFASDHQQWHFELFEPCVKAGVISASDLIGYRQSQVFIRGSKHLPPTPTSVGSAMQTLCELMREEKSAFARAVLGHFFFVYTHPYMDGNGRTARFVMNVMLVSAGFPWTVIPTDRREEYMASLEKASVGGDARQFASFVREVMSSSVK